MPELVCFANDPRWLEERRKGVTATDITAIIGLSPYESEYSLYFKKRGDIPDEHADNDRLRLGRELEPIILRRWIEASEWAIVYPDGPQLWRSTARPWQLATPDKIGLQAKDNDPGFVLQLKSWADIDRHTWADGPPARVRAQVLWQMDTLDVARGHVGVLFLPSGEFRSYVIDHDESPVREYPHDVPGPLAPSICRTCGDIELLREAGRDFMDRLDLNQPPSPDASTATLAALKARFADIHHDKQAEIDAADWQQIIDFRGEMDAAERMMRAAENRIREQAGEARILTVGGEKVATRVISDQNVKAHTRHVDYIRRVPGKGDPE